MSLQYPGVRSPFPQSAGPRQHRVAIRRLETDSRRVSESYYSVGQRVVPVQPAQGRAKIRQLIGALRQPGDHEPSLRIQVGRDTNTHKRHPSPELHHGVARLTDLPLDRAPVLREGDPARLARADLHHPSTLLDNALQARPPQVETQDPSHLLHHPRHADVPLRHDPGPVGEAPEIDPPADLVAVNLFRQTRQVQVAELEPFQAARLTRQPEDTLDPGPPRLDPNRAELQPDQVGRRFVPGAQLHAMRVQKLIGEKHMRIRSEVAIPS